VLAAACATIQLITRFHGDAASVFSSYDFTITCGAFEFAREGNVDHLANNYFAICEAAQFTLGPRFLQDLAKRQLVYIGGSQFPICALHRTLKYQQRGFSITGGTLMHIALSILQLDIKTYAELKAQLFGIDTMFLQNLLKQDEFAAELPVNYGTFVAAIFERLSPDADVSREDARELYDGIADEPFV
jgi:hypothetical protein